ncbi:MAG: peptide chain release factor 2 [Bacillota bacterium]
MELHELKTRRESIESKIAELRDMLGIDALKKQIDSIENETYKNDFWDDHDQAQKTIRKLKRLRNKYNAYKDLEDKLENIDLGIELIEMGEDTPSIEEDLKSLEKSLEAFETMVYLSDKNDDLNAIIEIHPGAGGTESHDWAEMLYRMYYRYGEAKGFTVIVNDYQPGGEAGIKSATLSITGENAFGLLKAERGVHRLVRISPFDSSGRRHTSFASVNVVPEVDETIEIELKDNELKIDTFRSSGAGGQSVNTTDSAVRITHLPTNMVVSCQNERSQIKNREQALKILKGKLYQRELEKQQEALSAERNTDTSNAFGSQIRSYVLHPYTMVKDHRTNEEMGNAQKVLDGDIDPFIRAYLRYRAKEASSDESLA